MLAVIWGKLATAELLVMKGANVHAQDKVHACPYNRACSRPPTWFIARVCGMPVLPSTHGRKANCTCKVSTLPFPCAGSPILLNVICFLLLSYDLPNPGLRLDLLLSIGRHIAAIPQSFIFSARTGPSWTLRTRKVFPPPPPPTPTLVLPHLQPNTFLPSDRNVFVLLFTSNPLSRIALRMTFFPSHGAATATPFLLCNSLARDFSVAHPKAIFIAFLLVCFLCCESLPCTYN